MNKKLLITSTDLMMVQFLIPHVNYLSDNGYEVTIACSVVGERLEEIKQLVRDDVKVKTVSLVRNPLKAQNIDGYKELKQILNAEHYDIIWTNEPVMGVMTRLAANKTRKIGTKVLYMAHGFHFYSGAPILNWLAYPIEKYMSRYNDVLVTINKEDFQRAKKKFHTPCVEHINGIGLNIEKYSQEIDRSSKRKQLGIENDEILILSVGELQKRKNHEPMIRAVARIGNSKIKYYICGRGELQENLQYLIKKLNLEHQVKLLGYRRDINEIMKAADIYAHPSLREGLGLASLEAMAAGLPLVTSNVQGIPDYVVDGETGFKCNPMDVDAYAENIVRLISDEALRKRISKNNLCCVKKYDVNSIKTEIKRILDNE
jgi:glycosyltransferase EpsD